MKVETFKEQDDVEEFNLDDLELSIDEFNENVADDYNDLLEDMRQIVETSTEQEVIISIEKAIVDVKESFQKFIDSLTNTVKVIDELQEKGEK